MITGTLDRSAPSKSFLDGFDHLVIACGLLLFLANILTSGLDAPIWLDENYSATIA